MHREIAVKGALDGLAEAARQVDVGGVDHQPLGRVGDSHDAVERMFDLFGGLLVARQADDLLLVLLGEGAVQGDGPGG